MTAQRATPTLLDEKPTTAQPDPGVKDVALVPAHENPLSVFERLAKDPAVDPAKLEKLIDLQERIMRHNARAAYDAAFARMAPKLPEISERGKILVKGTLRSTYARLEDIHHAIKPILAAHGFAIRHRTEWPVDKPGVIRIVGILSHEEGHAEESAFEAPADKSDYRTDIQSMGSTVSYGRRYTTLDLLNLTTRGADDDGQKSGRDAPPQGYEDWAKQLSEAAEKGQLAYDAFWECSEAAFKTYAMNHDRESVKVLKAKAATRGARR